MDREKVIRESEEAIDILAKAEEPTFWMDFVRCAFENALAMLKEQPEIVRCKDCRHHGKDTCSAAAGIAYPPPDEWFCADGERKDG